MVRWTSLGALLRFSSRPIRLVLVFSRKAGPLPGRIFPPPCPVSTFDFPFRSNDEAPCTPRSSFLFTRERGPGGRFHIRALRCPLHRHAPSVAVASFFRQGVGAPRLPLGNGVGGRAPCSVGPEKGLQDPREQARVCHRAPWCRPHPRRGRAPRFGEILFILGSRNSPSLQRCLLPLGSHK